MPKNMRRLTIEIDVEGLELHATHALDFNPAVPEDDPVQHAIGVSIEALLRDIGTWDSFTWKSKWEDVDETE